MPVSTLAGASGNPLLSKPDVVIFSDSFNRVDGNLIGQQTPVGKKTWLSRSGGIEGTGFVIKDGKAGKIGPVGLQFAMIDTGKANGKLSVRYRGGTGTNSNLIIPFRFTNVNNYYTLIATNDRWTLRSRLDNVTSTLGVSAITVANGQIIDIVLSGSNIKIYVDSILALNVTNSDNTSGTLHGIGGSAEDTSGTPAVFWDDASFSVPAT